MQHEAEVRAAAGPEAGSGSDGQAPPLLLVASLPDQHLRRDYVRRNLGRLVPYEFVDCVIGLDWSDAEVERHLSEGMLARRRAAIARGKSWYASGVVATALTHRENMLARIAAGEGARMACEDDVLFEPDALKALTRPDTIRDLDAVGGVILFNYRSRRRIAAETAPVARFGRYSVHRVASTGVVSGAAYYLAPEAAARLRAAQTPLRAADDSWDVMREEGMVDDIYLVHPQPTRIAPVPTTVNYVRPRDRLLGFGPRLDALLLTLNRLQLRWRGKVYHAIGTWL